MKQWIDDRHFAELTLADPTQLCAGGRAAYDPTTGRYTIRLWNEDYTLDGPNRLVSVVPAASSNAAVEPEIKPGMFSVLAIWYLLHPMASAHSGVWVSEHDFPGGTTFFRGPHQIPTSSVATACGGDPDRFAAACQRLGGERLAERLGLGDVAFRFVITPDIAVAVLLWLGDDDFPAEAKLLFDQSLVDRLPLDMVFCLASEVCKRLGGSINPGWQAAQ